MSGKQARDSGEARVLLLVLNDSSDHVDSGASFRTRAAVSGGGQRLACDALHRDLGLALSSWADTRMRTSRFSHQPRCRDERDQRAVHADVAAVVVEDL